MISYGRQLIGQDDLDAVKEALGSDFLTAGPKVAEFEQLLCDVTGARFAIACSNCTTALHIACLAAGVGAGDHGLTSPITFLASANAIEMCGGKAGLIDIDQNYCLDPDQLDEYCRHNPAPKVVIPVSFAGVPANLIEIDRLAKKYGFTVIEDSAHALGSEYTADGKTYRSAGCAHSDMACLSFHPVKTITTGEGGAVMTNDPVLADKLRLLRAHGIQRDPTLTEKWDGGWYYEMHLLGYNYRITDLQCALGISQLKKLEQFRTRRQQIVDRYDQAFTGRDGIITPPRPSDTRPLLHLYAVQFTAGEAARRRIYDQLKENGIYAQVHYIPVHFHPYYRDRYNFSKGQFPRAESYYQGCLSLPLHCGLTDSEVDFVIEQTLRAVQN